MLAFSKPDLFTYSYSSCIALWAWLGAGVLFWKPLLPTSWVLSPRLALTTEKRLAKQSTFEGSKAFTFSSTPQRPNRVTSAIGGEGKSPTSRYVVTVGNACDAHPMYLFFRLILEHASGGIKNTITL